MAAVAMSALAVASITSVPTWEPTYNMSRSTAFMPCNQTGFTDPSLAAKFGLADFDWSNAKVAWSNQHPMDCEERLVMQAKMVKDINPNTKVMVYRNLVKALPWYTSVREKITDPAYAGWFLHFKKGGTNGTGTWNVPPCTTGTNPGAKEKCSMLYHDQEQTPHAPTSTASRVQVGDWYIYNNTNDVGGMHPGWHTIIDGGNQADWNGCQASADRNKRKGFTFWKNKPNLPTGTCWLTDDWNTPCAQANCTWYAPNQESGHVSGWRPAPGETPPAALTGSDLCSDGDCDCGEGFPCGEYLWDHRNQSLRTFLLDEFVGGANGLANPYVDGFFFDDGWTDSPAKIPPWAPPSYRQCDMAAGGGATEEDFHCTSDSGLSPADVKNIHGNWSETVSAVTNKVISSKAFTFQSLTSRSSSLDLKDPRPTCAKYLQQQCVPNGNAAKSAYLFEFTRKTFHDPFPLPFVDQDVAMFLLVRGAYAWIGYNWMGCNTGDVADQLRPPQVEVDYGVPVDDHCTETSAGSGIFVRKWSKAMVEMNCNTWTATINVTNSD